MKVYGYDGVTGEYTGATDAERDPLAPGRFLMPHNCTRRTPPFETAGQAAVFDGGAWSLVPDHRGETWWDGHGAAVVVAALGDPAAAGLSADEPVPPPPDAQAYSRAVQGMLDSKARERGYDSILAAITYLDDPQPAFAAEAAALKLWRSAVWSYALAALAEVEAGTREPPGIGPLLAEIAAACPFAWPGAPA